MTSPSGCPLQCFFNHLAGRLAQCCILKLLARDQAPVQGLPHRIEHECALNRTIRDQIKNRAERTRVLEARPNLNVGLRKIAVMEDKHTGNIAVAPEAFRNSHVNFGWVQVRQFVQAERRLVAENALDCFLPISGPERPEYEIRPVRYWEECQTIDAAVFPNPVPGLYMVRMSILGESGCIGLFRGEESLLLLGNIEQASLCVFA